MTLELGCWLLRHADSSHMQFRGPSWLVASASTIGTAATVASLALLYLDVSGRLSSWGADTVVWIDTGLCIVMLAEWFLLLALVDRKMAFVKARWIDLIASIPLLLVLRPFRIVRLIRLLRLLRGIALFGKALRPWQHMLGMSIFKNAIAVAVVLLLLCSVIIMDLERNNPNLDEFSEAVWWALVTTTTVGYGDAYPLTGEGRFVAGVLMILGVGLFGTFAASMTAVLTRSKPEVSNRDLLERIEALDERINQLVNARRE